MLQLLVSPSISFIMQTYLAKHFQLYNLLKISALLCFSKRGIYVFAATLCNCQHSVPHCATIKKHVLYSASDKLLMTTIQTCTLIISAQSLWNDFAQVIASIPTQCMSIYIINFSFNAPPSLSLINCPVIAVITMNFTFLKCH